MVNDMPDQPVLALAPTFSRFSREMLNKREAPSFTGWKLFDLDTDESALASNDALLLRNRLVQFATNSATSECLSVFLPIIPSTEEDWAAANEVLSSVSDDDLPLAFACYAPLTLQRLMETLTETIHDEIPGYDDPEDFREDDFDNHPYTPLREALAELFT
ncbi:hypothetical protein [Paracoccus sp. TOH]|uniref:hypothetical protein n=1 Tax=Paracoccus sp. TOH TaxID=1263728 RepID=UPI0025B137BC|nr:hypothetical protein [Paracoccus sp. TOH]WJS87199.1 hypothetical protein NBE95_21495 [Paracoccus sp. TOH]